LHRVTRLLGPARAKELFLLAERFGADEARQAGVVTEVVPEGTALERALEVAARLAALPRDAVAVTKQAIDAAATAPREAALLIERLAYAALAQTQAARDAAAGFGS
jgi:enoyl-CoA hydratase/carnithine racemase